MRSPKYRPAKSAMDQPHETDRIYDKAHGLSPCKIQPDERNFLGEGKVKQPSNLTAKQLLPRWSTAWRRSLVLWGIASAFLIICLSLLSSMIQTSRPRNRYSASAFELSTSCDLATNSGASVQNAFTIDVRGSSRLSFTAAKATDVIFQLCVGAGGRFLLGWIAYKAFMDGLTRLLETTPVSFKLYTDMTFSTNSLDAVWQAMKAVFRIKGARGKFFLTWFIISTLYVLGFQTIISATAGYVQPSTASFQMPDGVLLEGKSSNLTSCFDVPDGDKIGLEVNATIPGPPVEQYDLIKLLSEYPLASVFTTRNSLTTGGVFLGNFNETYPQYADLLASALVTPDPEIKPYGPVYAGGQAYNTTFPFQGHNYTFTNFTFKFNESYSPAYCYGGVKLKVTNLDIITICVPGTNFVWGLSSLLVKIVLAMQVVWIFGTYVVWLDANIASELCRRGRKVRGVFRATEDLSEAMREVLGNETCAYSDVELAEVLKSEHGLQYYTEDASQAGMSHIGLTSAGASKLQLEPSKVYGRSSGVQRAQ